MTHSSISWTSGDRIYVHGRDLARDLIGQRSFTEMLLFELHGSDVSNQHVEMVDAVLVTLMEHGITPSTLSSRLALEGAPESVQGAIAAGILAIGSRFLGVVEDVAQMTVQIVGMSETLGLEQAVVDYRNTLLDAGQRVPGFGHNLHPSADPRSTRLIELAQQHALAGRSVAAVLTMERSLVGVTANRLTLNAGGAVGAILADLGYSPADIRGLAIVARCAGLVAHLAEERREPMARALWESVHRTSGIASEGEE